MQLALCPACRVVHQVVSPTILLGLDDEHAYRITHCQLCELSSGQFLPLKEALAQLSDDIGYPAAVVPLFEGQYRDWWLVGPEKFAVLAQAGLRVRLVRHLADEMRVPAGLVAQWTGLPAADALSPSAGKTLDSAQGLILLQIARLVGQVQEMVDRTGTVTDFEVAPWMGAWLQTPLPALGGGRPGDYLRLPDGWQKLSGLIARMESGAYS